jgi:SAM-dependent methyltransferase
MRGSTSQKIGRALANLALHPSYLGRVLRHNLLGSHSPSELELPWFSYAAIDFLEAHLSRSMRVCEYGSGGSTLFLAQRVSWVCSIEDDPRWFEMVSAALRKKGLENVRLKLCRFDFKNPAGFEDSEYLHAIPDEKFDVVVVDGSEEWIPVRPACFRLAEKRVKAGGIIVVDDSWRYPQLREEHHAKSFKIFQSVGPCRPGVTSTDIFFY